MSVELPIEVVRAINDESAVEQFAWLLKIYDSRGTVRLVNDTANIVGPDGGTYTPFPFSVTLPPQTGAESPVLRVKAADVALTIVDDIVRSAGTREAINADVFVVQRGVLQAGSNSHEALASYEGFEMVNAINDRTNLQFDLTMRNYLDAPLGKTTFNPGDFPGLF